MIKKNSYDSSIINEARSCAMTRWFYILKKQYMKKRMQQHKYNNKQRENARHESTVSSLQSSSMTISKNHLSRDLNSNRKNVSCWMREESFISHDI